MTMTVNAVLNHVVDVLCCDNPSRILSELDRLMHGTLHLKEVDAGLDIAICMVERRTGRVIYAGAGLPLTIISTGTVREVRCDNQRVGYKGSRLDYEYTNHELNLAAGDCCYLTTDGLLDEPGGNKGFGFGSKRFKATLAEHAHLSMQDQAKTLAQALDDYRGSRHQRDDITVAGFRF
jgi:sigma-B regulation protein RsbU (phosphoserine phosphatase)